MPVIVSSSQDKLIIKRFTYDWLIRFAELFRVDIGFRSEHEEYKPINSRLARTSPLFKAVLNLHAPVIIKPYAMHVTNNGLNILKRVDSCNIKISLPNAKRVVVVSKEVYLEEIQAGVISKLINERVYVSDAIETTGLWSKFTPAEFLYLAQHTSSSLLLDECSLTESVNFSDIWHRLKHIDRLNLDITNLVKDKNIIQALRHKPWTVRTTWISLYHCDVCEDDIMEMLECYFSFPQFPTYACWNFKPEYEDVNLQPIADRIIQRMTVAGYIWNNRNGVFTPGQPEDERPDTLMLLSNNYKRFSFH